jgi:peptidoglycan/xylan/chitin deacetylase (PgdA/CDA1 family)
MSRALDNRDREAAFLCYHSIADRGAPYLALSAELFERQLALLRRLRWRSGTIEDLESLARGERLGGRRVFLTFDDGFRDNLETAWPLLLEYGFRPLIFVLPGHLDEGGALRWPEVADAHASFPEEMRSLTWSQVDEMLGEGAMIGSHSMSHPHLCDLGDEALAVELGESRARLEQRIGACATLAYPFGECDGRVVDAAKAAGYRFAFSLPQGPDSGGEPLRIPRLNVDRRDRPGRFALKLSAPGRRFLFSDSAERTRGLLRSLRGAGERTTPA